MSPKSEPRNPLNTPATYYSRANYCAENSIGFLMRSTMQGLGKLIDQRMQPFDLTDAQWKPLLHLYTGQCSTAVELARLTEIDTGAMTRLLDRLETKGLIQRQRSQDDRRVIHLLLTEAGEQLASQLPDLVAQTLNQVLHGFSDAEVVQFKGMLQRLKNNIQQINLLTPGA